MLYFQFHHSNSLFEFVKYEMAIYCHKTVLNFSLKVS